MTSELGPAVSRGHRPLSAAVVATATIGTGALWLILSMATGLIFHFMPGAPMIAAVWVRRAAYAFIRDPRAASRRPARDRE